MIKAVGGTDAAPAFMGIGGSAYRPTSPNWIPPFLNRSKHSSSVPPIDYVSIHHYATCSNRTDPSTYSSGFFGNFKSFMEAFKLRGIAARDASSFPDTKLDLNEIGTMMPGDHDAGLPIDADLPDIYWNAAGATFAYVFATLAPLGVEAGVSQHRSESFLYLIYLIEVFGGAQCPFRFWASPSWLAVPRSRSGVFLFLSIQVSACWTGAQG